MSLSLLLWTLSFLEMDCTGSYFLVLKPTICYSEHYNSFVIQKTSELCTVYQCELYHYNYTFACTNNTGPNSTGTELAVILKTRVSTLIIVVLYYIMFTGTDL